MSKNPTFIHWFKNALFQTQKTNKKNQPNTSGLYLDTVFHTKPKSNIEVTGTLAILSMTYTWVRNKWY